MPHPTDGDALQREGFASLALDRQLEILGDALARKTARPHALLELAAGLRDAAPLAWLCARLLETGFYAAPDERSGFARFLLAQPDTTVRQVLRATSARLATLAGPSREAFCVALLESLSIAPLERLAAVCLIDRALTTHFPAARAGFAALCVERATQLVAAGAVADVPVVLLAHVPARAMLALRDAARGAGVLEAFDALHARLATEAIAVLGAVPKALSQSNAEELLSRRVYTDAGHFLVELLQNAEDAGATRFRVCFEPTRVLVVHDGAPFDARDLVGVTSIGQTTKRQQQIGFFGVGFKSVYEVTDRPQIHSGVYRFEIADVSIPRALAPASTPAGLPDGATALVLPLRDPGDPARSPRALFERACLLDPCVLLTLRSIAHIELELDAHAAGGPLRRALHATSVEASDGLARVRVREEPSAREREFLLAYEDAVYPGHEREAGRPDRTRVLVGVRIERDETPAPLERGAPTVYSFLPTREASGLRVFVQGHFDVPVDRERVAADSPWNRWIVSRLPVALARAAAHVVSRGDLHGARGLLDVLPLERELTSPAFRGLGTALREALTHTALVPCADGALHAARNVLVAPARIATLFAGDAASAATLLGRSHFADPALPPRSLELVVALGGVAIDDDALLAALEDSLANVSDGSLPSVSAVPPWLSQPDCARLAPLLALLDAAVERDGARLERVRSLPLFPGADGGLHRARGLSRAPRGVRVLCRGQRPMVHAALDPLVSDGVAPGVVALLDRLGVPVLDTAALLDELARGALPRWLSEPDRRDALLALCADGSHDVQARAARLAVFEAEDGRLYPAATHASDVAGALRVTDGAAGEKLRAFYAGRRPLLAPGAQARSAGRLLERLNAPQLDAPSLVQDVVMRPGAFGPDTASLRALHALLESLDDALAERDRKLLGGVAIWPDRRGIARALRGPTRVLRAAHDDVVALFPAAPFLDDDVARRAHVAGAGAETIDPEAVIASLAPDAPGPLRVTQPTAALAYLAAHADAIRPPAREALAALAVFPADRGGSLHRLSELRVASSPALRAVYDAGARTRVFLDEASAPARLLRALGLLDRVPAATVSTLIEDLVSLADAHAGRAPSATTPFAPDRARLDALHAYLASQLGEMPRLALERLVVHAAVFPDERGALCRAGDLRQRIDTARAYPCDDAVRDVIRAAGMRPMDAAAQATLGPILAAARVASAKLDLVLELLARLPRLLPAQPAASALQSPTMLARVQALLVGKRDELPASGPPLASLCIWRTEAGAVIAADEVVNTAALDGLIEPGTPEHRALGAVRLDAASWQRFAALAPRIAPRPAEQVLEALVAKNAKPGLPLAAQMAMLATVDRVTRVAASLARAPNELLRGDPPVHPMVDAVGRLRMDPLRSADAETAQLVAGLGLDGERVHPDFVVPERWIASRVSALAPHEALACALGEPGLERLRREPGRRAALYAWLVAHEREVFSHGPSRELLRAAPIFPTERGTLRVAHELVTDPALPDLGVDWRPSPSIPRDALALLERHLGAGRPPADELVRAHLRPAYVRATAARDGEHAAAVLRYAATLLAGRARAEITALLQPPDAPPLVLEDARGGFAPAADMVLAPDELAPHVEAVWGAAYPAPSPARYPATMRGLLVDLGVRTEPSIERLRDELNAPGRELARLRGLCALLGAMRRARGPALIDTLALRTTVWLPDATGTARRPGELFAPGDDVDALVGAFAELLPDAPALALLGEPLARELGLRTAREATLGEVLGHLDARAAARSAVGFRVYHWLDARVRSHPAEVPALLAALGSRRWVHADDGTYFDHARVLGVWAHQYFGTRRGYWERGRVECSALCAAVGIGAEVTPAHVESFLLEVAGEVARVGDAAVLGREPALPRMLLACYARLGEANRAIARDVPIVLATERNARSRGRTLRLVRADAPNLVRSDTPTLDALFEAAGPLLVAHHGAGSSDDRDRVERFHAALNVRRLRDAYTITVDDDAGRDVTDARTDAAAQLRGVLRALCAVLPRVRAKRGREGDTAWVFERRLRPLATSGALRAVDPLRVRYALDGVGEVRAEVPAAFDRARGRLLVDARVLDAPDAWASGLASALVPAIHDGPGDDALVDMIEILLPLATAERMNAYLDRRHFPVVESTQDVRDALSERVGELLDLGLDRRLAARFAALRDVDLARWREPSLLAKLDPAGDRGAVAARAARTLLDAVGLGDDAASIGALRATLTALLAAPSLRQLPSGLLAPAVVPTTEPAPTPLGEYLAAEPVAPIPPANSHVERTPPAVAEAPVSRAGFFRRMLDWFGDERAKAPAHDEPAWAHTEANTLAELTTVGTQFWATPDARRAIAARSPRTQLAFEPSPLPSPHAYAINAACARFDARTQAWTPDDAPAASWFARGRRTGRIVTFEGTLAPGTSRLPVPLHSALASAPAVLEGDGAVRVLEGSAPDAGSVRVLLRASTPVRVRYAVELLEPPPPVAGAVASSPPSLLRPTLPLRALPTPLREWIERERARVGASAAAHADAAVDFVRRHYVYDDAFLLRDDVGRARAALRTGEGNHHLALLHASAEGAVLGRGVCYEINVLLVEVLRQLGVPSMVCVGWVLDGGRIDRPDHLFAVAVLPSRAGPVMVPLDAAVSANGSPIRTLDRPPERAADAVAPSVENPARAERQRLEQECALLEIAIRMIAQARARPAPALPATESLPARQAALARQAGAMLPDAALLGPLLALLRGEYRQLTTVPPDVEALVRLGLAKLRTVPAFEVVPVRVAEP